MGKDRPLPRDEAARAGFVDDGACNIGGQQIRRKLKALKRVVQTFRERQDGLRLPDAEERLRAARARLR